MNPKQMGKESAKKQFEKYGGEEGYKKEMKRRSKEAHKKRWGYVEKEIDKTE